MFFLGSDVGFRKIVYLCRRIPIKSIIMSIEEKKARMAANRAINSKKPARTPFVRWARAHKGAFIVNDPELKAKLTTYID